jgi:tRNA threonylcarbamoyl adenosine modification protein YeaZ
MLILACDTSTLMGSVGWIVVPPDAGPAAPHAVESHAELIGPADPGHAETLLDRLDRALSLGGFRLDDVELLVFSRGPGTFTGLRIGLATAKGLALARGLPLIGVPTLELLALGAPAEGVLVPLVDARRGEVWGAAWRRTLIAGIPCLDELAPARVLRPDEVPAFANDAAGGGPLLMLGTGALRYRERLAGVGAVLAPDAAVARPFWMALRGLALFGERGADDPASVEPVYLRAPDARPPAPRSTRGAGSAVEQG